MRNRKRRREDPPSSHNPRSHVHVQVQGPLLSPLHPVVFIILVFSAFTAISLPSIKDRQPSHLLSLRRRWPGRGPTMPGRSIRLAFDGPPQEASYSSFFSSSSPPPSPSPSFSSLLPQPSLTTSTVRAEARGFYNHAGDAVKRPSSIGHPPYPAGGATPTQAQAEAAAAAAHQAIATMNGNGVNGSGSGNGSGNAPLPPAATTLPRLLDFVSVYKNGTVASRSLRKSDLAHVLGCPTRDLRLIDASFPGNYAAFLSRRSAILLCVERVKAVIKRDEVMVFDPQSKEVTALVPLIQQQLMAATSNGVASLPFEHLILETVLGHVIHNLRQRLHLVTPPVARILADLKFQHLGLNAFQNRMDELLPLRNTLSELHSSVQELRKAMDAILMSDEDMALMYLTSAAETGRGRRLDQHQEVEMLFENYLMQLEWVDAEIKEIQHAIQNTGETVEIQLDLLRNRILRFELILNMVSCVVAMGALVTGVFGMNLLSGLEMHPAFFYRVTTTMAVVMLAVLGGALIYALKGKLI